MVMAVKAGEKTHLEGVMNFLKMVSARTSPVELLEEEQFRMREGFDRFVVEKVEENAPDINFSKPIETGGRSIRYFESSIQRTQLVGHFLYKGNEIPIHYAIIGSLILERIDGHFQVWAEPATFECVIAPLEFVPLACKDAEELSKQAGIKVEDSGASDVDYTQLRIAAVNFARREKWRIRTSLVKKWRQEVAKGSHELLALDDFILHLRNEDVGLSVAGVVKMTYVPFKGREKLSNHLLIKPYRRGEVFKIYEPSYEENMKYSWFLRIREKTGAEPEFGLIRIEITAQSDEEAVEEANLLSEAFVRERLPVTYPAPDWDKIIFPHKIARQYVESLFPTRETIRSFFKFA